MVLSVKVVHLEASITKQVVELAPSDKLSSKKNQMLKVVNCVKTTMSLTLSLDPRLHMKTVTVKTQPESIHPTLIKDLLFTRSLL